MRRGIRGKGNVSDRKDIGEVSGICEMRTIRKFRKVERGRGMSELKEFEPKLDYRKMAIMAAVKEFNRTIDA